MVVHPPSTAPTTATTLETSMQVETQPPVDGSNVTAIAGWIVAVIVTIIAVLVIVGLMLMR